jgi:hypothetical protein
VRRGPDDLITAGEVACFVYCPEQWRLQYGQSLPAENQAVPDAGTRHHAGKAGVERVASWSVLLGQAILLAAPPAVGALAMNLQMLGPLPEHELHDFIKHSPRSARASCPAAAGTATAVGKGRLLYQSPARYPHAIDYSGRNLLDLRKDAFRA